MLVESVFGIGEYSRVNTCTVIGLEKSAIEHPSYRSVILKVWYAYHRWYTDSLWWYVKESQK